MDKSVHQAAAEAAAKELDELSHRARAAVMTQEHPGQTEDYKSPVDPVFPRLVNETEGQDSRLIGLIAYGLFQDAKREWASDFRTREGRYPSDEELRLYERSWTESRLEALQNAAAQTMTAYTDSVLREAEPQILRNALKGSVWRAAWVWLVGAVLYTIVVVGVIIVLARSGVDVVAILSSLQSSR